MTTPTSTSTTSTTEPPDLLAQIASELADLQPERNAYGVKVAGLHLTYGRHPGGAVSKGVILINTGYLWRKRSTRRFTQVDPRHLAQQVRRILREQTEMKERVSAYWAEQVARDAREKAESADIAARAEAAGKKVHQWEVEEVERDGSACISTSCAARAVLPAGAGGAGVPQEIG
jgi:hypothetical protein